VKEHEYQLLERLGGSKPWGDSRRSRWGEKTVKTGCRSIISQKKTTTEILSKGIQVCM